MRESEREKDKERERQALKGFQESPGEDRVMPSVSCLHRPRMWTLLFVTSENRRWCKPKYRFGLLTCQILVELIRFWEDREHVWAKSKSNMERILEVWRWQQPSKPCFLSKGCSSPGYCQSKWTFSQWRKIEHMVHMLGGNKVQNKATNKVLKSFEQIPEEARHQEFMVGQINDSLGLSEPSCASQMAHFTTGLLQILTLQSATE